MTTIIQANRDELLKPLQTVTGIVERRHTIPILSNVLIEKQQGKLTFLGTDLEIQIHTFGPELNIEDFRITTNAKKLQDILRALPDHAEVRIEYADNIAEVRAGKSKFQLQTLAAEDFPLMSVEENIGLAFSMPQGELRKMIALVQYAMAVQDIRYYLNGMLVQVEGQQLRLITTDGHRLAYVETTIEAECPATEMILPRKGVLELFKLLTEPDEQIKVEFLHNQIRFCSRDTVIVSKVVDGKFPDYKRVIPLDNDKIFRIERSTFQAALERAAILASTTIRGVTLKIQPGLLTLSCTNNEQENAEETLEIAYQGDPLEISFNIQYLMDVLRSVQGDDVQLAFGQAERSVLITVPEEPNFKYIVMPMKI